MIRRVVSLLAVMVLAGCGADSPGSGGSTSPPSGPPPVVLVSIAVVPGDATIGLGDSTALTAMGTYSNGHVGAVSAAWSSSHPSVTLDAAAGTGVVCTGAAGGASTITATVGALSDDVQITVSDWLPPADPGPVYGDGYSGLARYPTDGSAPTYLSPPFTVPGRGLARSPDGAWLYVLAESAGSYALGRLSWSDPTSGGVIEMLDSGDAYTSNPWGLEVDSAGRVYAYFYDSGRIVRHDPSDGTTITVNTVGMSLDIGLDPSDNHYWTPLIASAGGTMISTPRTFAPGVVFNATWAMAPADEAANFVVSGVTFNRRGECFTMNSYGTRVYKIADLNGDGDATDAGEVADFAALVGAYGDTFTYGLSATLGVGVLVNRQDGTPGDPSGKLGVWWVVDRNGDGDASDAGEVTLYNGAFMDSGLDGGCLANPR